MDNLAGKDLKPPMDTESAAVSRTETKSSAKRASLNEKEMLNALSLWEATLKSKTPRNADHEFGRVHERMLEIGRAISNWASQFDSQRCAACHRPFLEGVRPKTTIPHYDYTSERYINWYACSATCAAKLIDRQREEEAKRHGLPASLLKSARG
jgi:hypothetical protein